MGRQKHWTGVVSRRPRRFTDADVRRMVDRRADGVTLEDIARSFGTSANTVRVLVRAATRATSGPTPA